MSARRPWRRFLPAGRAGTPVGHGGARGVVLRGRVWTGGSAEPFDGAVAVNRSGVVVAVVSRPQLVSIQQGMPVVGSARHWVVPGIIDTHVHLGAAGSAQREFGAVVGVRDLGGPREAMRRTATQCRRQGIGLRQSGPVLVAPSVGKKRSAAANGRIGVPSPQAAASLVDELSRAGSRQITVGLAARDGHRTLPPDVVIATVQAAHDRGLPVIALADRVDMVERAVAAGVDELGSVPTDLLGDLLVERIAAAGITVCSGLQKAYSAGVGASAMRNARALVRAGVRLRYGTDSPGVALRGVDPRELERLAETGLGRWGALRTAAAGWDDPDEPRVEVGRRCPLVLLAEDPLREPVVWKRPALVVAEGRMVTP